MADSIFVLPDNGSFSIQNSAADSLISRCDGNAAIVYLYILRNGGCFSQEQADKNLRLSRSEINRCMRVLSQLGLVSQDFLPDKNQIEQISDESLPKYSVSDIKEEMEGDSDFSFLVEEFQRRLGRVLSANDLSILFGIHDYLEIPPQVVLLMLTHCIEECQARYGEGRLPTMRRIEKTAFSWKRMGLTDLESAEAYLKNLEEKKADTEAIKSILQISNRKLTASEEKYINGWLNLGFPPASIEIAYDRTISQAGKLAWPYMNAIINNWHGKGLHTPEEISAGDTRKPKKEKESVSPVSEEDTANFDQVNLDRMKKLLDNLKND